MGAKAFTLFFICLSALLAASPGAASHAVPHHMQPALQPVLLYTLPVEITSWEGVAAIAVLLIITVAAIVYMLSGATGSSNARAWSRMQIYEALMSFLLIGIFGAFSYMFFMNPQGAFQGAGLLPKACAASNVNDLYNLSACDLSSFMTTATGYFATIYYLGFIAAATVPGFILNFTPLTLIGQGTVSVQLGTASLLPASMESMLETGASGLLSLIVLNQVQMILISGSLLFLSLFMVMGLVARCFGFTRTFGGSLIAFGLGLGLVYPLLVSMSYGFIDVQLQSTSLATLAGGLFSSLYTLVLGSGLSCPISVSGAGTSSPCASFDSAVLETGYLIVGLLIIPFLNFAILDAFIVDFSRAMGERVDFMSMIGSII